jgi:hypothetical protein
MPVHRTTSAIENRLVISQPDLPPDEVEVAIHRYLERYWQGETNSCPGT